MTELQNRCLLSGLATFLVFGELISRTTVPNVAHTPPDLLIGPILIALVLASVLPVLISLLPPTIARIGLGSLPLVTLALTSFQSQVAATQLIIPATLGKWLPTAELQTLYLIGIEFFVIFWFVAKFESNRLLPMQLLVVAAMALPETFVVTGAYLSDSLIKQQFDQAALGAVARRKLSQVGLPSATPNVVYIVPDRYSNLQGMQRDFDLDNSSFYQQLRKRGFLVAENAHANYGSSTFLSLISSLNFDHLPPFITEEQKASSSRQAMFPRLTNNHTIEVLKAAGYRYVHMGSWAATTRSNSNADLDFFGRQQWLDRSKLDLAILYWFPFGYWLERYINGENDECLRLKSQLSALSNVLDSKGPTFVFAHILIPHEPITIKADGSCRNNKAFYNLGPASQQLEWPEYRNAYADYVRFLNRELLAIIDTTLSLHPNTIILLLADEGAWPKRKRDDPLGFSSENATVEEIRSKFGILRAMYGPPELLRKFCKSTTSINDMRNVVGHIYSVELPLNSDKAFMQRDPSRPYDLVEVTDKLPTETNCY